MECKICGRHEAYEDSTELRLTQRRYEEILVWEYICAECTRLIQKLVS